MREFGCWLRVLIGDLMITCALHRFILNDGCVQEGKRGNWTRIAELTAIAAFAFGSKRNEPAEELLRFSILSKCADPASK